MNFTHLLYNIIHRRFLFFSIVQVYNIIFFIHYNCYITYITYISIHRNYSFRLCHDYAVILFLD